MAGYPGDGRDRIALDRALAVAPAWDGLVPTRDVVPLDRTLLHAGPPVADPAAVARPILNSAALAAWYEGWSATPDEGEAMIVAGEIALAPAQDHGVVVPLAGIASPSMVLQRVRDAAIPAAVGWSPFNGGMGPAMRLGLRDPAVVERWRWLNGAFAESLAPVLAEPVPLLPIAAQSLARGDDCHGRTPAATAILAGILEERGAAGAVLDYLGASPAFFLNLWMAASKCMLRAAEGVAGSSLITAMGGNGVETGFMVAGLPGRWFTAPADPPEGPLLDGFGPADRLGAIGDSAIVDGFGLGAMALSFAPEQRKGLAGHLPDDVLDLPRELLLARHPAFGELDLLVGQSAAKIVAAGKAGVVSLGILDKSGAGGRIGGGLYRPPLAPFRAAAAATAQD